MGPAFRLFWRGYRGKPSQQTFWLPEGLTIAAYVARANALRNAARGLSSAVLERGELEFAEVVEGTADPPALSSDVRRNLVLFFRDEGGGLGTWRVPSPALLPYDTAGPWRGIRLSRDELAAAGLLGLVEAAAALTIHPWGTPFPSTVSVGGIDFVVP